MLKRVVGLLLVVAVLSMSEPGSAVAQPDDIIITGSGWGDGVGLSQYGARAMADSGIACPARHRRSASGAARHGLGGSELRRALHVFDHAVFELAGRPAVR